MLRESMSVLYAMRGLKMVKVTVNRKIKHNAKKGVTQGVLQGLEASLIELERRAVKNAPHDKGALRASITRERKGLTGFVGTNLIYAMIQEFGGVIKAINAKYLRFKIKGHWVTKKQVTIPAANGGKGYMRPAAAWLKPRIGAIFGKYIRAGIRSN
jgi:hypothetical protein